MKKKIVAIFLCIICAFTLAATLSACDLFTASTVEAQTYIVTESNYKEANKKVADKDGTFSNMLSNISGYYKGLYSGRYYYLIYKVNDSRNLGNIPKGTDVSITVSYTVGLEFGLEDSTLKNVKEEGADGKLTYSGSTAKKSKSAYLVFKFRYDDIGKITFSFSGEIEGINTIYYRGLSKGDYLSVNLTERVKYGEFSEMDYASVKITDSGEVEKQEPPTFKPGTDGFLLVDLTVPSSIEGYDGTKFTAEIVCYPSDVLYTNLEAASTSTTTRSEEDGKYIFTTTFSLLDNGVKSCSIKILLRPVKIGEAQIVLRIFGDDEKTWKNCIGSTTVIIEEPK